MTALVKAAIDELRLDFFGPIARTRFAFIMLGICGFIAGASFILFERASSMGFDRGAEIGLAISSLVSIVVLLHTLGHAASDRDGIAWAAAVGGSAILVGAFFVTAVTAITTNLMPFILIGMLLMIAIVGVARASWIRENSSKIRTALVAGGALLAQILWLSLLS